MRGRIDKYTYLFAIPLAVLCFYSKVWAVSVDELASRPKVVDVKISPTGEYLGIRMFQDGKHGIVFISRETAKVVGTVSFAGKAEAGRFYWANSERVVMEIYEVSKHDRQPKYYGELFAANYDGSKAQLIFGMRSGQMQTGTLMKRRDSDRAWAEIIDLLPDDDQHILISSTEHSRAQDRRPRAQKLNIYNGLDSRHEKVAAYPAGEFFTDASGQVRVVKSYRDDQSIHVEALPDPAGDWIELNENAFGSTFLPVAMADDGQSLFVLDDINNDKRGLHKLALDGSTYSSIYTNERVDITSLERTTDRSGVFAMRVDDGYPRYLLFSQAHAEAGLFKKFLATFPGKLVSITSRSRDGRFWVAHTSSDTDPGSFFLYDDEEVKMRLLFHAKENLNQEQLAAMEPVSFTSFDGREVSGYFTAATAVKKGPAPLVVLVHGGPRARDYWGFNPEVQALATNGYSVLQINYRGSSGYGTEFMKAGNRQWGNAVQRDIIAGTRWAIEQGRAAEGRLCIMGVSFGGYSALQSAILEPDLFACAIANAGVYDLEMMYTEGDIEYLYLGNAYLEEAIGRNKDELKSFSPARNAQKLKAPLLLAHGERDRRAPYQQAKALKSALDKHNKEYETFFDRSEGHGFYDDVNRASYWKAVLKFLGKHLDS